MNRSAILVIGTDEKKLHHSVNTLSYDSACIVVTAAVAEEAIEKFHQLDFELVVFINDLQEEEKKLTKIFTLQHPGVAIIKNDNIDLLRNEIKEAAGKKHKKSQRSFSFVDDALKNAMLPIKIQ